MRRLTAATGLIPVEYPTTRKLGCQSPGAGGGHQCGVRRPEHPRDSRHHRRRRPDHGRTASRRGRRPQPIRRPFVGYSDNTNLLNWLWSLGITAYYGGSTQVHLGAGPGADDVHVTSLRAALLTGGELEVTDPGESEDFGPDWLEPRALVEYGDREPTEPWAWTGPERTVAGNTWGGCIEVLDQLAIADRLPSVDALRGAILILETSELLAPAHWVKRWVRALGERGVLGAVDGVMVARPPVSSHGQVPPAAERARLRAAQRDVVEHRNRTIQPGRRRLPRDPVRAHPTAVDPPVRRSNPARRSSQDRYRQLCLIVSVPVKAPGGRARPPEGSPLQLIRSAKATMIPSGPRT